MASRHHAIGLLKGCIVVQCLRQYCEVCVQLKKTGYLSETNLASPGGILAMQQLCATSKSLTCPPLSIVRYSFIQLSQLGRQWNERKCPIFETVGKGDSNPGSLYC